MFDIPTSDDDSSGWDQPLFGTPVAANGQFWSPFIMDSSHSSTTAANTPAPFDSANYNAALVEELMTDPEVPQQQGVTEATRRERQEIDASIIQDRHNSARTAADMMRSQNSKF